MNRLEPCQRYLSVGDLRRRLCRRLQNSKHPSKRLADDLHGLAVHVAGKDQRTASRYGLADVVVDVLRQLRVQISHHRWTSKPPSKRRVEQPHVPPVAHYAKQETTAIEGTQKRSSLELETALLTGVGSTTKFEDSVQAFCLCTKRLKEEYRLFQDERCQPATFSNTQTEKSSELITGCHRICTPPWAGGVASHHNELLSSERQTFIAVTSLTIPLLL